MRVERLLFTHLILFIFFIISVNAQQVSETPDLGFTIVYPQQNIFNSTSNTTLFFHVFNGSGIKQNASLFDCSIRIYELNGSYKVNQDLNYDTSNTGLFYTLNSTDYTNDRDYSYDVYCNTTRGAFVSSSFKLMQDGYSLTISQSISFLGIGLIIFLITALFFVLMQFVDNKNYGLKVLFMGLGLINLTLVYYVIFQTARNSFNSNISSIFENTFGNWLYVAVFLAFLILVAGIIKGSQFWYKLTSNKKDDEEED